MAPPGRLIVGLGLLLAALSAPSASADVQVEITSSVLVVNVTQPSPDAAPERGTFIVEHFADLGRNGIRVRDRGGAFEARITSNDSDCFVNAAFNDAICQPFPSSGNIRGGLGPDNIDVGGSNTDCAAAAATPFEVDLRGGDDRLRARFNCGNRGSPAGINRLHPQFLTVHGGDGNDDITGSRLDDTLFGDDGGDDLSGGDGNDTLLDSDGADMSGGSGNDTLRAPNGGARLGGTGDDTLEGGSSLNGGSGNDTLTGSESTQTFDGGIDTDVIDGGTRTFSSPDDGVCEQRTSDPIPFPGFEERTFTLCGPRDLASYGTRTAPVTVTLDGVANDGEAGEGDQLLNIESLRGGLGGDTITGSSLSNQLEGRDGNDTLDGLDGPDALVGGNGTDVLRGGLGDDTIDSRDGIPETVNCGGGTDHAIADSQDRFTIVGSRTGPSSCESIEASPVDDGRPGLIVNRSITIRHGRWVTLGMRCPRDARVSCRGRLRLLDATGPSRTLAVTRYAVRRRHTGRIRLRLSRRAAARMREDRAVVARTTERGVSKKGPRRHAVRLRVRRGR